MKTFGSILYPFRLMTRYQTLVWCLSRHGILGSLTVLGLECGKRGVKWISPGAVNTTEFNALFGKNLARTFQEMGPTFIKLGQMLASRPDIVGENVAEQLEVLFSRVRPIPVGQVKKILSQELGKSEVKKKIKSIEKEPLGSASIGQTHRAILKDGTPVVIKVQKPGVAEQVRLDLSLLEWFVTPAALAFPKIGLQEMFQDFKSATLREIDYREEARNIERFKKNYKKVFSAADVVFPDYFPDLSTERLIVLEPMRGQQVSAIKKGSRTATQAAHKSLAAVLEQIFDHGFFHADPHAANLFFIESEGKMGFIDLGLVGQLEPKDKALFVKVVFAILQRDRKNLAKSLFELGTPGPGTDFGQFDQGVQNLLDEVKAVGIEKIRMEKLVNQLLAVARQNQIYIPNRYVMMIRSCLIAEGLARSLDPQISVFKVALPVVARSLLKSYNPFKK